MDDNAKNRDLWTSASAAVEALLSTMRQTSEPGHPAEAFGAAKDSPAALLTEAYLIWLSAGLRCASGLATHLDGYRDVLARFVLDDQDPALRQDRQATVRAIRELVAELGELAVNEAVRLRAELAALAERLTEATANTAPYPADPTRT